MSKHHWMPKFETINPEHPQYMRVWRNAMDDIRIEVDYNLLKDEFVNWTKTNMPEYVDHFSALPAWHYATAGRIAFAINRGAIAPADTVKWFNNKIQSLVNEKFEIAQTVIDDDNEELTARAKKVVEYVNLYSFIDALLTKYKTDTDSINDAIKSRFQKLSLNRSILKKIYLHFKDTMNDAIAEADNPEVEKTIVPLVSVVNLLAAMSGNAKITYKSKKVSNKTAKAVSKMSYKEIDSDTNLASVSPTQIPGTNAVVIYNTKNRKVVLYKAKDGNVLNVKGTKIIDFDENTTVSKTIRKPKEVLPMLRNAINAKRIDIVLGYVNGKNHKANGKINKDMVILKVFK